MRAFKGFNKDLTCRGYQYEEGKEFHTERAECCDTGFHACEYPLDCFGYYDPAHSVFHEVELSGEMDKSGDNTKVCATDIKIGARLSIAGLVKEPHPLQGIMEPHPLQGIMEPHPLQGIKEPHLLVILLV